MFRDSIHMFNTREGNIQTNRARTLKYQNQKLTNNSKKSRLFTEGTSQTKLNNKLNKLRRSIHNPQAGDMYVYMYMYVLG